MQVKKCGDFGTNLNTAAAREDSCFTGQCVPNILHTNGASKFHDTQFIEYYPVELSQVGVFRLCWCAGGDAAGEVGQDYKKCNKDHHFAVQLGHVTTKGIAQSSKQYRCHLGEPCRITVETAIPNMSDKIQVIPKMASSRCGQTSRATPSIFWFLS